MEKSALRLKEILKTVNSEGRTVWIVDAHRDDGKRFVVRADELLTAFVELESAGCNVLGDVFHSLRTAEQVC